METDIVMWAGTRSRKEPWSLGHKPAPGLPLLWICLNGRVRIRTDAGDWELGPGDVFHGLTGVRMTAVSGKEGCTFFWTHFSLSGNELPALPVRPNAPDSPFLFRLCSELGSAWQERGGRVGPARHWLRALLAYLESANPPRHDSFPLGASVQRRLWEICRAVRVAPGEPWRIDEMARRCGVSRGHFSRAFRDIYGVPPRKFVTNTRIQAAADLLRQDGPTVGEVAERLGFADVYHFSKSFKRVMGEPPTSWLRHGFRP